jgi:hypothetical protein
MSPANEISILSSKRSMRFALVTRLNSSSIPNVVAPMVPYLCHFCIVFFFIVRLVNKWDNKLKSGSPF